MDHLAKVRESQKAAKIRQLADMARVEQREFQRVVDANRQKEQEEVQQVWLHLPYPDLPRIPMLCSMNSNELFQL